MMKGASFFSSPKASLRVPFAVFDPRPVSKLSGLEAFDTVLWSSSIYGDL